MDNIVDEKIENLNKSVEGIVEKLAKMNSYGLTVEDIYEYIKGDSEIFKKSMHFSQIVRLKVVWATTIMLLSHKKLLFCIKLSSSASSLKV